MIAKPAMRSLAPAHAFGALDRSRGDFDIDRRSSHLLGDLMVAVALVVECDLAEAPRDFAHVLRIVVHFRMIGATHRRYPKPNTQ